MIDRSQRGQPLGPRVLVAGALIVLSIGVLLAYRALDWAIRGCDCSGYPGWTWTLLLAAAAPFFVASVALFARAYSAMRQPHG